MLTLNTDILAQVVTRAKQDAAAYPRWVSAIERAAVELERNPYIEAMDDHTLLLASESGQTYTANGVCGCTAFSFGQPCWHRAAARLYTRYLEAQSEHISLQARKAYAAARGPNRPLFAERDAETMRRAALSEERAVLEEQRRIRKLAAERATALLNETFA